ncbi:uncharacterized protein LOC132734718 [Ruditapes philippinarum]|uniref:uncharacterized protein LOC132734718 n=1 Tax=Ruditapes philippinarum TaxID=129788 RepID=UPI00295B5DA8|nr:uncharacterized protein LOC132734718 [Ruditapes philippinarum]XP_060577496.1 uncharacterized protein LOC132734718 [Ruditapes philippinarum]
MYLVNIATICVAFLGSIICQVTNQGQDAGQNFPTEGRGFLTDGILSSVERSVPLPDGRLSAMEPSVPLPDGRLSALDRSVPLPDGRLSAIEHSVSGVDRSISLPDGRLSGVDRSVSLPDGRLSGVDRSVPLPDGRLSAVERQVGTVDRINLAGNDRGVASSTNIAQGIINGSRILSDGRTSAIARVFSSHREDYQLVHTECERAACSYPSLCYIPHPTDCFKFIMCQPLENGRIMSQAMPCAFGTKWKQGFEPACDRYNLVDCPNDKCKNPMVKSYSHHDSNCRTHWTCVNGKSRPACCARYHSYDVNTNKCVSDITCDAACPLLNDATCGAPGVRLANFADGNCRTHWDCEHGHPHPVCCPDGQGFDVFTSRCVPDRNCIHECPKEYSRSCSIPGTQSYDLVDKNCRTYMKCNKKGQADPTCCLNGLMYDVTQRRCISGVGSTCINAKCPFGYFEECRLEAVPGNAYVYKNLDAYGGMEMPCPVGTIFNATGCQCSPDPILLEPSPRPTFCTIDIVAKFPDLKNKGSAVAALLMIGKYGQGETGVGNMINFWDGGAGINIPFYGSQVLNKLYLEARLQPTAGSQFKQVFATSCNYVDRVPTFEVNFDQFQGTGGTLTILARTDGLPGFAEISFPYNFNDEFILRVIYDGQRIGAFLDSTVPNMSNSAARSLSGFIPIHRSGLRFAHCRNRDNMSGFIGHVSEIKFGKCLTREMHEALNSIPAVV